MKKIFALLFVLMTTVSASWARNITDDVYKCMASTSAINYSVNYHAMKINDMSGFAFVQTRLNMSYDTFAQTMISELLSSANEELVSDACKITNDVSANIVCDVELGDANDDGGNTAIVRLTYRPTNELIDEFKVSTNVGLGDGFRQIFTDGMRKSGKKLGKKIAKIRKKMAAEKN